MIRNQRFIGKRDGSAAVEFALLAPLLFLLMVGIVELGLVMFASSVLENAATTASRVGLTGNDGKGNFGDSKAREAAVRQEVMRFAHGIIDPNKVKFDPQVHNKYTNVNGKGSEGLGSGNQAVIYDVTYEWKFFSPLIGAFFKPRGVYTISSSVIVKNEDF